MRRLFNKLYCFCDLCVKQRPFVVWKIIRMSTSPGIRIERTFRNTQIQEIIDCMSLKVKALGKGIFPSW